MRIAFRILHFANCILHRDVKPENFLIGLPGSPNQAIIHMVKCKWYHDDDRISPIEMIKVKL